MSKWSLSVSMISDPHKTGTTREVCSSKGRCQLLGSEHRSVVLWVYSGVVAIPLFWVDVPSSSKRIGFGSQFSGMETYDEVEGGKKF